MIICLDTSTPTCKLTLVSDGTNEYEWAAGRELAKGLLGFLEEKLKDQNAIWNDIEGLAVFRGPGSFTGLRIGITVMNTLADSLQIPIIGETSDDWRSKALARLKNDENDRIVLPEYGADAHITQPKK
jgi:tRNA threonylcarbamoyladenosine biosynthesis protein TsaB